MKRLALLLCAGLLAACADDVNESVDQSGKISAPPAAQHTTPLWASVPETISPEWGAFFSEKGQGRETPMPAPDDLEAWKAVQAANDEAKEAKADEKAAAFGVTYEESEIAGIPVIEVTPSDFAKTLIAEEGLGDDNIIDYLGVSYSATDYIGHFFGPSSLESEDNILRLDRTLADLFAYVDQEVGLENTLIVLSADHGGPEAPGYLESIDLVALETMIAKELVAFPGVSYEIPSTSLERATVPDSLLTRAVLNNYNPMRSGNIYVVFNQGWFINDLDGLSVAVVHGSPWRYDTYVPIIFAGNGIKPQTVSRRVHTVDVAITLATAVGTRPPSGAAGEVLLEVLGQQP